MVPIILSAAAVIFIYMTVGFVLALILKNNSIVDIAWGPGFVLTSAVLYFRSPFVADPVKSLFLGLITIWGMRLAGHVFQRNLGKPEDFRYAAMRKRWGKSFVLKSFFFIFMLQGVLMLVVASPAWVVLSSPARRITALDIAGTLIFAGGFLIETVADYQLSLHIGKPENKGKLMTGGLWSLSRHPNHFGEATLWWGLGLLALSSKYGWIGLLGPVAITFLLRVVSGVPLLEKKYAGRPDWEAYKLKTPIFLPRLPRPR